MSKGSRRRGVVLTDSGLEKLLVAIRAKFPEYQETTEYFEKISQEVEKQLQNKSLSDETVKNILKRSDKKDKTSIDILVKAFGLPEFVEKADYDYPQNTIDASKSDEDHTIDDPFLRWVGRENTIQEIVQQLTGRCRVLSIVGMTGIGKTSLAIQLTKDSTLQQGLTTIKSLSYYGKENPDFEMLARKVLGDAYFQKGASSGNSLDPQQAGGLLNPDTLIQVMVKKMQENPVLLFIDMIEVILKPDGKGGHQFTDQRFQKFFTQFVATEQVRGRIIMTSQDEPPVFAEGRFDGDRSVTKKLEGLTETETLELFEKWQVNINNPEQQEYIKRIHAIYEGHPLTLRVIAGEIISDFENNITAYWKRFVVDFMEAENLKLQTGQSNQDRLNLTRSQQLEKLVKTRLESTFDRLQVGFPLAYELLCKGAVHRQPVSEKGWLILLLQDDQSQREKAFKTLNQRNLLQKKIMNEETVFGLHNLIRQIALERLNNWENAKG